MVAELETAVANEAAFVKRLEARGFVQPPATGFVHERASVATLLYARGQRAAAGEKSAKKQSANMGGADPDAAATAPAAAISSRAVLPKLKAPLPRASRGVLAASGGSSSSRLLAAPTASELEQAEEAASRGLLVTRSKLKMREGSNLDSREAGDMPAGFTVLVIERCELPDGTQRACVAADGESVPRGWVSAVRDGVENLLPPDDPAAVALVANFEDAQRKALAAAMQAARSPRLGDAETPYSRRHGDPSELIKQSVQEAKQGRRGTGQHWAVQRSGTILGESF